MVYTVEPLVIVVRPVATVVKEHLFWSQLVTVRVVVLILVTVETVRFWYGPDIAAVAPVVKADTMAAKVANFMVLNECFLGMTGQIGWDSLYALYRRTKMSG